MRGLELRNTSAGQGSDYGLGPQRSLRAEFLCPRCGTFSDALGIEAPSQRQMAYVCRKCRGMTLVEVPDGTQLEAVTDYYPKMRPTVDASVPTPLAEDYLEAQRCFSVGARRACAVMARRFVHSVMQDKGAVGSDLYQQIKDLEGKRVLTPNLAEASQHIRIFGKYGAHPFELCLTALAETTMEDAQAALGFCEMLIEYVYVLEARIQASRAAAERPGSTPAT